MLAPAPILHDPPVSLLADVRALLAPHPELVDQPEHLAASLGADVFDVLNALEALEVEGEVLA